MGRPRKYPRPGNAFGDWFRNSGISPHEVARAVGCSTSTVYNLANGQIPSLRLAVAIQAFTAGAVPTESWGA